MQFALLVYESPEAFKARNGSETDPYLGAFHISELGGRTIRRSSRRVSMSVAIHWKYPRLGPRCGLRMESGGYRMALTTPRSNWVDS